MICRTLVTFEMSFIPFIQNNQTWHCSSWNENTSFVLIFLPEPKSLFQPNKSQVPQICSNGELHPLQGKLRVNLLSPLGFPPWTLVLVWWKCSCWGLLLVGERCVPIQGLVSVLTIFIYVLFPVVVLFISVYFAILCVDLF